MTSLAVLAFPGNNCETETARAAVRNGFECDILRWNEPEKIGNYDGYILPGGFSFEDRGRSGLIPSREPIFDRLREEAQKGKIILGICNGAQMIVESGLIPIGDNSLPFSLAHNIRRNREGRVMGTGLYNTWVHLVPERTDTAFTTMLKKRVLHVPISHGEGRFTSVDKEALKALESGTHVAFRYSDEQANVSEDYPTTPNGSQYATAAIVNKEGTIMAMMPHPERFFEAFDGDQIFQSMKHWIQEGKSPKNVKIGDFSSLPKPEIEPHTPDQKALLVEKQLLITDNEAFSVSQAASHVAGEDLSLTKSTRYEITGVGLSRETLLESGLLYNPNKEFLQESPPQAKTFAVKYHEDDEAKDLSHKLSHYCQTEVTVKRFTCWQFPENATHQPILQNRLLANPNAATIYTLPYPLNPSAP